MSKQQLLVIKIGGNVVDSAAMLEQFTSAVAAIDTPVVLVHGGGKLATELSSKLNIPTQMVEGRRITDSETIKVVTMTYAGWVNKSIVSQLQAKGCNAIGLSGADAKLLPAIKRPVKTIDYGWVGDLEAADVNTTFLKQVLEMGMTPVVSPISCDREGHLLNINADTIARTLAEALSNIFQVRLIYCFEKKGLLTDIENDNSVIELINETLAQQYKADGTVSAGMVPKVDNALGALQNGVHQVVIGHANDITHIAQGAAGYGTYFTL